MWMAKYRRWRIGGGTYFFTLVLQARRPLFANPIACRILGEKFRECQKDRPFEINAIVLLPEHLHTIWTLPPGDDNYPQRWAWIKKEFTKQWLAAGGSELTISEARKRRGDRGIWQPRYWEHSIADEHDFDRHFDYVHYNAVKHGHVTCPRDWLHSSFHRWVNLGLYDRDWGCARRDPLKFDDLDETAMEF
jgi:putative transposase